MAVSTKTVLEKIKNKLYLAELNPISNQELIELTSALNAIYESNLIVETVNDLPPAENNQGRIYYVEQIDDFRFSNGENWIKDYASNLILENLVYTWGNGGNGRLGDGYATSRSSPVSVVGGFTDWCKITVGSGSSVVALRTNGTLWAWGWNSSGNLGDGTVVDRSSPVSVVGGFTDWCEVSKAVFNTAAIRTDGSLWTWGANTNGELGAGYAFATNRSSPVSVIGGFTDWCTVSVGRSCSTAAIRTNCTLWTWGKNSNGTLGDNTRINRSSPVSVIGTFDNSDWVYVSSSFNSIIGLKNDGTLWSWGNNDQGKLGDGTVVTRSSPVSVVGGFTDWCAVSAGTFHAVAIRTDGSLWTWGANFVGQLGDGYAVCRSSPVSVLGGFTDWCAVYAGRVYTIAMRTDGVCSTLWAWGYGGKGQLGDNCTSNRSSPVSVVGSFCDWCAVSAGGYHTAAIRTNGSLWSWGEGTTGRLGDGFATNRSSPVSVVGGFTDWCAVSAGKFHTAAIRTNGTLWTWGCGGQSQLGDGFATNRSSPVSVVGGFCDWCAVSAGSFGTAAIRTDGSLWTWGCGVSGQLGDGYEINRSSPVSVLGGFTDWCEISAGELHTAALRTDGSLWTWGNNIDGQLGLNKTVLRCICSPEIFNSPFGDFTQISIFNNVIAAIRSNGSLWTWGNNSSGALGDGTFTTRFSPVSVLGGFTDWCAVGVSDRHIAAVRTNGTLWTWGNGGAGKLGHNCTSNFISPVSVVGGFTDWCAVTVSCAHTAAIRTNGTIWTWGCGSQGQLGDGYAVDRSSPVSVVGGFTDWCAVSAGNLHNAALRTDGSLWTWGFGSSGRLGANDNITRSSPVSVVGGFTDWCAVTASYRHTAAIRTDGTLWTWGSGVQGQLGDGYAVDRSSPVSVVGGFTDWCTVKASCRHTAAIRTDGTLWSWGNGSAGRLGDGYEIARSSPVSVVGGFTDWCYIADQQVSNSTVAIRQNKEAYVWGVNCCNILLAAELISTTSPVNIVGDLVDWCAVSVGGAHTAALRTNGTLWTWGHNDSGQLAVYPTLQNYSSPVSVNTIYQDWCAISSNRTFSAAIRTNGTLWTWGCGSSGQLANNCQEIFYLPQSIVGNFTDWNIISTGWDHAAAIRTNGTLWTWGNGGNGRLGDGFPTNRSSPVSVVGGFTDWCAISSAWVHTAAIRTDGSLWTWGANNGRLGDGYTVDRSSPVSVVGGFSDWCAVSAGTCHTAALRTNGSVWTWGSGLQGRLGDGYAVDRSSPVSVVGGFTDWCAVSVGGYHTAAIRTNGTLWTWGCGGQGRLGDGFPTNRSSPVSVVGGFTDWCAVSAGRRFHTAALRTDGSLWTWGSSGNGQLGDGYAVNRSSPVSVVGGFTDWCAVSISWEHTNAIRTDGTLWTWGGSLYKQLATVDPIILSPVSVVGGFTDWCAVSAGDSHTAAIRSNGTMWTWGSGATGQLGDSCSIIRSSPVSVVGGFTDWCAVSAGWQNTAGIRTDGSLWTWGAGSFGALGNNCNVDFASPVSVAGGFTDWCAVDVGSWWMAAIRIKTVRGF